MKTTSSPILLALAVSVNVASASEGGGGTVQSQKYECTDGITQIDYFTSDCTGEVAPLSANPTNPGGAAFDKCFNPSDGYSYKTVSCGDGDGVYDTFNSNDCTGVVDAVLVV